MSVLIRTVAAAAAIALLSACGGGGGKGAGESSAQQGGGSVVSGPGSTTAGTNCTGSCADTPTALTVADVQQVIAQAVAEGRARQDPATIAVVDRVGNVLGVFRMAGADAFVRLTTTADGSAPVVGGLESVNIVPAELAAIAKAVTGAYLSSEGNAFSTRTASQIVQEHLNPGEFGQPSGPLFGVQFSQLACGDFVTRFVADAMSGRGPAPGPGPRRSPLGLAADPGGLPLYKAGTPVGGIGVIADGIYGLDKDVFGFDRDVDEYIATAGTVGFAAPVSRRADVITLGGKSARFSEAFVADLMSTPAQAPAFATINGAQGALVGVRGYYDGGAELGAIGNATRTVLAGVAFGQPASGIRPAAAGEFQVGGRDVDAFVFVDQANQNRFPPRAGFDQPGGAAVNALTATEVRAVLANAVAVANRGRAQIRQPDGTPMRVTVSVVDSDGGILGMARTRDAPVFGADVSLQKARTAAFWSGSGRVGVAPAAALRALPDPVYIGQSPLPPTPADIVVLANPRPDLGAYATQMQQFLGIPTALEANGAPLALTDRAIGNLARPHYPDGPTNGVAGPLSKVRGEWSVFSVGVQLDLVYNAIIQHVAFVLGVVPDVGTNCTGVSGLPAGFASVNAVPGLANGTQIFPGGVPIYRGNLLVGAIGVSGDGVDQDDMVAFLGVHNAGGNINNAPAAIRADVVDFGESVRLRYVNCPQAPYLDTSDDDVCNGR